MNRSGDGERLLDDVLAEGAPAEFRTALLGTTLRLARRRRWRRRMRGAAAGFALVAGLAALIWRGIPTQLVTPPVAARDLVLVRSRPLAAGALVTTRPFPADRVVASATGVHVVETAPDRDQFRDLGDEELLALIGARPAALVRRAPHEAELVFVDPADRNEFFGN